MTQIWIRFGNNSFIFTSYELKPFFSSIMLSKMKHVFKRKSTSSPHWCCYRGYHKLWMIKCENVQVKRMQWIYFLTLFDLMLDSLITGSVCYQTVWTRLLQSRTVMVRQRWLKTYRFKISVVWFFFFFFLTTKRCSVFSFHWVSCEKSPQGLL